MYLRIHLIGENKKSILIYRSLSFLPPSTSQFCVYSFRIVTNANFILFFFSNFSYLKYFLLILNQINITKMGNCSRFFHMIMENPIIILIAVYLGNNKKILMVKNDVKLMIIMEKVMDMDVKNIDIHFLLFYFYLFITNTFSIWNYSIHVLFQIRLI